MCQSYIINQTVNTIAYNIELYHMFSTIFIWILRTVLYIKHLHTPQLTYKTRFLKKKPQEHFKLLIIVYYISINQARQSYESKKK